MTIQIIDANATKAKAATASRGVPSGKDFNSFLSGVGAMGDAAVTGMGEYYSPNAATVLAAAFSGTQSYGSVSGGGYGYSPMYGGGMAGGSVDSMMGLGSMGKGGAYGLGGTPGVAGSSGEVMSGTGIQTGDLINTMNNNNLQLLELQAMMQNNMQVWNTKSNIMNADHRAKMAMIEKFSPR